MTKESEMREDQLIGIIETKEEQIMQKKKQCTTNQISY